MPIITRTVEFERPLSMDMMALVIGRLQAAGSMPIRLSGWNHGGYNNNTGRSTLTYTYNTEDNVRTTPMPHQFTFRLPAVHSGSVHAAAQNEIENQQALGIISMEVIDIDISPLVSMSGGWEVTVSYWVDEPVDATNTYVGTVESVDRGGNVRFGPLITENVLTQNQLSHGLRILNERDMRGFDFNPYSSAPLEYRTEPRTFQAFSRDAENLRVESVRRPAVSMDRIQQPVSYWESMNTAAANFELINQPPIRSRDFPAKATPAVEQAVRNLFKDTDITEDVLTRNGLTTNTSGGVSFAKKSPAVLRFEGCKFTGVKFLKRMDDIYFKDCVFENCVFKTMVGTSFDLAYVDIDYCKAFINTRGILYYPIGDNIRIIVVKDGGGGSAKVSHVRIDTFGTKNYRADYWTGVAFTIDWLKRNGFDDRLYPDQVTFGKYIDLYTLTQL